jgi:hypothetical protein
MSWTATHILTSTEFPNGVPVRMEEDQKGAGATEILVTLENWTPVLAKRHMVRPIAQGSFTPTHRTYQGTPLRMVCKITDAMLRMETRDGRLADYHVDGLIPMEAPAAAAAEKEEDPADRAEREHDEHAAQCAPCGQDIAHRVTLANWAKATDASRAVLAHAVTAVLRMNISTQAQATLEKALAEAGEELAKFRP